jgi:structural maintenance of chromosome 3 (chondroitin sulfate proteoglycan 6)
MSLSFLDLDKDLDKLMSKLQDLRASLENVQGEQTDDSRSISKQQKATERYLAKKAMLHTRKDECNRSIRDLGVLPEEAFGKYTNDKLDRVSLLLYFGAHTSTKLQRL